MQVRKCYFCDYETRRKVDAEDHLRSHTKETPYFCGEQNCSAMFARTNSLVKHRKKIHNILNIQTLKTPKTYECYFCSNKIRSFSIMIAHLSMHTMERPFKCSFTKCTKYFHTKTHQRTHYGVCDFNPDVKVNLLQIEEKYKQVLNECGFQCYFCHTNFKTSSVLFKHIKTMHLNEKCETCFGCKMDFHYRDINKHKNTCAQLRKLFVCKFCNVSKPSISQLNHHIQNVHTQDTVKLKCYFCNLKLLKSKMTTHLATHTKETLHKCHHCQVYVATRHGLQYHIGVRHADTEEGAVIRKEMQRKCYFCLRYFTTKWYLKNHMFVHTKETR